MAIETTLTVAELAAAIATLGGGGYAGGRAVARQRVRAEERRFLLKFDPTELFDTRRPLTQWQTELVAAEVSYSASLLPWLDRFVMAEFGRNLEIAQAKAIMDHGVPARTPEEILEKLGELGEASVFVRAGEAISAISLYGPVREHLVRRLRWRPSNRVFFIRCALRAVRARKWPWSV